MLIAEDVLVLLTGEHGRVRSERTEYAVAGGLLAELALLGAVGLPPLHGGGLSPIQPPLTIGPRPALDDPLLAEVLDQTARHADSAVGLLRRQSRRYPQLRNRLAEAGVLVRVDRRVLGPLVAVSGWPSANGPYETAVRAHLGEVLSGRLAPDARSGVVLALVGAAGGAGRLVGSDATAAARVAAFADADPVAAFVRLAIRTSPREPVA